MTYLPRSAFIHHEREARGGGAPSAPPEVGFARRSFGGFNADVERRNAALIASASAAASKDADVGEEEMADALGGGGE